MKSSYSNFPDDLTEHKKVVLMGIAGGIAAYKAISVASSLFQSGFITHVALTQAAEKFVSPLSFAAVTNRKVLVDLFSSPGETDGKDEIYPHLYPATYADIFLLIPATADIIAKIVHGHADDVVTTSVLSLPKKCNRFFCPAMNVEMWNQEIVKKNIAKLEKQGWSRIGPEEGQLSCGAIGEGRMAEPEIILENVLESIKSSKSFSNKRFLILSGPTVEPIDGVRFISNSSSGKMGKAVALSAAAHGAQVTFISGPVAQENLPQHPFIRILKIRSAKDMLEAAKQHFENADITIFAAAVADFAPRFPLKGKSPKSKFNLKLELQSTSDIAATLTTAKRPNQICIGFSLEATEADQAEANAKEKIRKKGLDAIVLNYLDSFDSEDGNFTFIKKAKKNTGMEKWGQLSKSSCARKIMSELIKMG